jgi:alkenylglycerophosphocholine/alkenylglycerophosphoethanolamine hydrolase
LAAVLWAVAVAAACAHLFGAAHLGPLGPIVKAVPVGTLAAFVVRQAGDRLGGRLGALGLAISSLADAAIEFSFVVGLAAFFVAHLCYIAAFTRVEPRLRIARLAPFALWAALALPFLSTRAGALRVPVIAYGLVIFIMMWRAAALGSGLGKRGWSALAGAILFGVSDTLLGYSRFVAPLPASEFLIMGTYWAGQSLIAASFLSDE